MPGWNARIPPGVVRCECAQRREWWARLSPQMGAGCCSLPCCGIDGRPVVVMASREEIQRLRAWATFEAWDCPRCGKPISAHWRGFECVDRRTLAVRAKKGRR